MKNLNYLDDLEKVLCLEQRFFLSDHNLIYTDKMSMAAGVEVRVPFLDLDLVKFASQIPSQLKLKDKECKWILKKQWKEYCLEKLFTEKNVLVLQ